MREEPSAYRSVRSLVRFVLRRWFRRVEVVGEERLPREGGGILVSWHPNGLLDPALIVAEVPRPVIFGARHGLFRWPLLGTLMKAAGAVPIYRAADVSHLSAEERRAQNQQSLDALALAVPSEAELQALRDAAAAAGRADATAELEAALASMRAEFTELAQQSLDALALAVAEGGLSCLFPEGDSHDEPHLLELKTGVARFYERACALTPEGAPRPVILPVGLHYADKDSFRSHALVSFHPPLEVAEMDPDASDRYEVLTDRIEEELREVVHATESWEAHYLMHRARKIVLTERAKRAGALSAPPTMSERVLGLAEIWRAYYAGLDAHPEETQLLEAKVRLYDRDLRSLGLDDHELDRSPTRARPLQILGLALQILAVFVLLPPLLVF